MSRCAGMSSVLRMPHCVIRIHTCASASRCVTYELVGSSNRAEPKAGGGAAEGEAAFVAVRRESSRLFQQGQRVLSVVPGVLSPGRSATVV